MQKGSINVDSFSIFKLINLQSKRLEFFRHDLHRDVFGQVWLMCKKDLLFVRPIFYPHIDGKYDSANAPLVQFFFKNAKIP